MADSGEGSSSQTYDYETCCKELEDNHRSFSEALTRHESALQRLESARAFFRNLRTCQHWEDTMRQAFREDAGGGNSTLEDFDFALLPLETGTCEAEPNIFSELQKGALVFLWAKLEGAMQDMVVCIQKCFLSSFQDTKFALWTKEMRELATNLAERNGNFHLFKQQNLGNARVIERESTPASTALARQMEEWVSEAALGQWTTQYTEESIRKQFRRVTGNVENTPFIPDLPGFFSELVLSKPVQPDEGEECADCGEEWEPKEFEENPSWDPDEGEECADCGEEWDPKEFEENPSWDPAVRWCDDFFRQKMSLQLCVGSLGNPSEAFQKFFSEEISQLGAEECTRAPWSDRVTVELPKETVIKLTHLLYGVQRILAHGKADQQWLSTNLAVFCEEGTGKLERSKMFCQQDFICCQCDGKPDYPLRMALSVNLLLFEAFQCAEPSLPEEPVVANMFSFVRALETHLTESARRLLAVYFSQ